MKKLFASAAVLALFTASSFAQDFSFKNVKLYGEGSIYGFSYENASLGGNPPSNVGGTGAYFTLGARFDVVENATASFALGYTNIWGDGGGFAGRAISDPNSGRGLLDLLRIVEANISFAELFDVEGLSVKLGRQYYGDEDSGVMYLGIRRDNPVNMVNGALGAGIFGVGAISSADGAAAYYEKDKIKANIVYGILANGTLGGAPNITLMGGDFKYTGIADMFNAQVYIYDLENFTSRHYTIVGVKPSFEKSSLKASIEFAKNFGGDEIFSNEEANTNFVKIDASYNIEDIKLTPRASYGVFGSENEAFFSLGNYTPGLIIGQQGAFNFQDNRIINVGADYSYGKIDFAADLFNLGPRDGDWDSVNEINVSAKYNYSDNVYFRVGIGHLFGNDAMDYDASALQGGVVVKFN